MSQARKSAFLCIHEGKGPDTCRRIPHPHPSPPGAAVPVTHRGDGAGVLYPVPEINDCHTAALCCRDGCRQLLVAVDRVPTCRHDHISQAKPGLLGGVFGAEFGDLIRESHHQRPVGKHFDPKGRAGHGDGAGLGFHRTHRLDRYQTEQAQSLVGAAGISGAADRSCSPLRCTPCLQEGHGCQSERGAGFHIKGIGQCGPQAQHGNGQKGSGQHQCLQDTAHPAPCRVFGHGVSLLFHTSVCAGRVEILQTKSAAGKKPAADSFCYTSMSNVPATFRARPRAALRLSLSLKTRAEKATVTRMLSLSTGATTLAGPS